MAATFLALHAPWIFCTTRCMTSVVVRPGLPPNWVGGSRFFFSGKVGDVSDNEG